MNIQTGSLMLSSKRKHISLTIALLFLCGVAFAQPELFGKSETKPIDIEYLDDKMNGEILEVDFGIPYTGIVEFHLFDDRNQKIWKKFYKKYRGDNSIRIHTTPLEAGEQYAYEVVYKGRTYRRTFSL